MSLILSGTDGLSDVDGSAATPAIRGTDANTGIFFPAADTIAFSEGGAECARFDSSGNFSTTGQMLIDNNKYIGFKNTTGTYAASIFNDTSNFLNLYNSGNTGTIFYTNAAEQMRLTSTGLGIGTTSPATKLEITASAPEVRISSSNAGQTDGSSVGKLSFFTSDPTTPGGAGVAASIETLSTTSNGSDYALVISKREGSGGGASYINLGASSTGAISFGTNTSGSATERVRIDSSGSLLVGKTSATTSSKLEVDSLSDVAQFYHTNSSDTIGIYMRHGRGLSGFAGKMISFRRNDNTEVGSIVIGEASTSYNTSSDYRLKNSITPMTGALAKVALLKPCTYKWNSSGSNGQGFIAHELAEVVPECVTGEKDAVDADGKIKPQGVDTSFLVATLTAAIQEQQALITQLTARITALEGA